MATSHTACSMPDLLIRWMTLGGQARPVPLEETEAQGRLRSLEQQKAQQEAQLGPDP